jgi:pimeloyl-ACP methyl ester carboxylesterase
MGQMEVSLKKALLALACSLASLAVDVTSAQADDNYRITQVGTAIPTPGLRRTTFTVSTGDSELDSFQVVRVRQAALSHLADPPVIMLSPFGFPAEFWEITSEGPYADTFAARLASADYDVWLVDSRIANLPPGSCESGSVDCSPMATWGMDLGIDDAMFVEGLVKAFHPLKKPVIGGFSGGSSAAIAAVDRYPKKFAGLFMWEGTIYTADPAIRARNAAFCADDEARLAAGVYFDPAVQGFKTLFQLADAAPSAPSPIPVFPPGTTNLQALLFALSLPDATNPLNFTESFIRFVGDPFTATLTYSNLDRVMEFGPLIGTYAPVPFIRDSHCAMGGLDDSYSDNLSAFRGDVLVYAEGRGFGQMMLDTANLMTRADVTVNYNPEFAESDPYFHKRWVKVAVNPLLKWLRGVRFF